MVVPWQKRESLLTTAKSLEHLEQAEIDVRKQQEEASLEEIKRKETDLPLCLPGRMILVGKGSL